MGRSAMSDPIQRILDRLTRVSGLRGAMVVDRSAGVPVQSELEGGVDATALAALAASLFRQTGQASTRAGYGAARTVQLEAKAGHLVITSGGDLLVVALVEADAQLGMVRLETERAAMELEP